MHITQKQTQVTQETPWHIYKTIKYLIFNPKMWKIFPFFSLYKFKTSLRNLRSFY